MIATLFVYGTLVPGYDAWPVLAPWTVGAARADSIPGALFDTGRGYPGATFAADASGVVHGVVVELDPDRVHDAFAALDDYEGPEYERITVQTAGGLDVATYAWVAPVRGYAPLPAGRWPR